MSEMAKANIPRYPRHGRFAAGNGHCALSPEARIAVE
jgi:hypothetical protein